MEQRIDGNVFYYIINNVRFVVRGNNGVDIRTVSYVSGL